MDVDHVLVADPARAPHGVDERLAAEDAVGMGGERSRTSNSVRVRPTDRPSSRTSRPERSMVELCDGIVETQLDEIAQMQEILERY